MVELKQVMVELNQFMDELKQFIIEFKIKQKQFYTELKKGNFIKKQVNHKFETKTIIS